MIYLDNSATTLIKPKSVQRAVLSAMQTCANPGRGGHRAAMRAANVVYDCREAIAELFSLDDPTRVIFTQNATHALNIAIQNLMRNGGHAVVSGYEHNSVIRPLAELEKNGCSYTVAYAPLFSSMIQVAAMERAIRTDTVCVICNHVSNVFGCIQNIEAVNALCRKKGIPLILDLSQSAGTIPVSVNELSEAVYLCMPGHKGLYGPQGTGILICCKGDRHYSIMQGGTGSDSMNFYQPADLPEGLESGTLNVPGIAGLREGVRFVQRQNPAVIGEWEKELAAYFVCCASNISGITIFHRKEEQSGVVSFTHNRIPPEELSRQLSDRGFCLRAGLHCAPVAHQSGGTLPTGTLRVSFSAFNDKREVNALCNAILKTIS